MVPVTPFHKTTVIDHSCSMNWSEESLRKSFPQPACQSTTSKNDGLLDLSHGFLLTIHKNIIH